MEGQRELDLLYALSALQHRIGKRLGGALTPHGISYTEFLVLRELDLAPDHQLRRIDLARQVGLTASGVTRLLNPLEKIGMVRKEASARDARVSLVALTESGERIYAEAAASVASAATDLLGRIQAPEQEQLAGLVRRLL